MVLLCFVLGDSLRDKVCHMFVCVVEFAHYCDYEGCWSLCYSFSELALDALFCKFFRTRELFLSSLPRSGLDDGSFFGLGSFLVG